MKQAPGLRVEEMKRDIFNKKAVPSSDDDLIEIELNTVFVSQKQIPNASTMLHQALTGTTNMTMVLIVKVMRKQKSC